MLPGFRFLFAAIVLSMSVLVFGLGAAAVLRAAHEQFAESGSWRPAPDTPAAQQGDMSRPVLAVLRVDAPKADAAPSQVTQPAQPAEAVPAPEPDQTAALEPQAAAPAATAKPDTPEVAKVESEKAESEKAESASEPPTAADSQTQPAVVAALPPEPAHQNTPATQPAAAVEVPAAAEPKTAAADPVPPAIPAPTAAPAISPPPPVDEAAAISTNEAFPAAPEHPGRPAASNPATSRIATLGGPPVVIEEPAPEKAARAGPDPSEVKKERDKERAEERARRRRLAARRAKQAQEAAQAQAAYPFGQANQTVQYVQPGVQPGQTNANARTR